jgi:AbrB family looped-hinge helix DNA binding protein
MIRTTLSPKYQIVIPKEVRQALKLRPGSVFNVIENNGRIELLPVPSAREMRGFLRGTDTTSRATKIACESGRFVGRA